MRDRWFPGKYMLEDAAMKGLEATWVGTSWLSRKLKLPSRVAIAYLAVDSLSNLPQTPRMDILHTIENVTVGSPWISLATAATVIALFGGMSSWISAKLEG